MDLAASGWLKLTVLAPSHLQPTVGPERKLSPAESFSRHGRVLWHQSLVLVRNCQRQVNHREQHENECLDARNKDVQAQEDRWNANRNQREEAQREHIAGKHVGIKTNGEGQDACEVRNKLDGHQQPCHPPERAAELFQIAKEALRAEALVVVIEERGNREAEWDNGVCSGGSDARNQPYEIVGQHEEKNASDECLEFLVAVADDLFAQRACEFRNDFGDLLRGTRLIGESVRRTTTKNAIKQAATTNSTANVSLMGAVELAG